MSGAGKARTNHEKAQRAAGVVWPDHATMKLWREHGGEQHGPHVETVMMPMYLLQGFLDDYASAAVAAVHASRVRLAASLVAVEAERDALALRVGERDQRIAALQADWDRLEGLFWIELREPGKVPQRKGPFRKGNAAATLREFFAARPEAFISVVSVSHDGPAFTDGPEWLEMLDRRSRSVAKRHRETTRAAFAARALAEPRS